MEPQLAKSFPPNVWPWNNGTTPFWLQMPPFLRILLIFFFHAVLANLRPLEYESFYLISLIRVFNHFFPVLLKIHFYFYLGLCECMHHAQCPQKQKRVLCWISCSWSNSQFWTTRCGCWELSSVPSGKAASTNFNSTWIQFLYFWFLGTARKLYKSGFGILL